MRIIAGTARGRAIVAPQGMDTRPTLDRVRESLFNILQMRIRDSRVLDLFAGSGALGLESLSRGAESAVFVDQARAAQEAVQRNIDTLRMQDQARLLRTDWRAALKQLAREGTPFDLVFLDPPYRFEHSAAVLDALRTGELLALDALVVYEYDRDLPPQTAGWKVNDTRRYGDTEITFLQWPDEGDNDADSAIPGQL